MMIMKTLHTIYTNFAKRFAVVLTLLLALGVTSAWAATETATLDFTKANNCTSIDANKQIWTENGITLTNDKHDSPTNVTNYTPADDDPIRCYKNSKITITHTSNKIAKIVFKCSESKYNISIGSSEKYEVNANGNTTTVTFKEPVASYEQVLSSGQVRLNSIEVTYEAAPSTFTVTCKVNEETPWGTLSSTDPISDLASGTSISAEGNVLTIGETEITASSNEADAQYTYAFKEWTWQPADATITSDVVATATFTRNELINYRTLCTYNIEYTNLEGTTHTNPVTYTAAILPLTFTAPTSTREGYTFAGWNPATLSAETRGDLTVTALWQVNSHTLTWKVNGGDALTGEYTTGSVEYGTTIIPPANPTRTGYTFAGWGAEVAQTMPDHDLVYTAQWTVNTYTITLDQQGATTPGTTTVEATYGSALPSIAENLPTKTGYDFGGYYTEINGNGTQYYHGTGTGARNWDIASETTLYAYWKPNTCTLIFNMNGGVGEQPNLTATYDQPMPALTAPLPTLSGYEFSGYFDEKTGGVMYYNAAGESARNWDKTNGQKTLYAQWAAIHTVTWMVNGNRAEGDPTTSVVNGQTITTLPTTPDVDCNGKVFVGWTTATIHGETATAPDPLYTELGNFPVVTSNMTFNAVFANGSGDEHWVETEIGDIQSGDEVVVTMTKEGYIYAMSNNRGTTIAPEAIVITVEDGIINQVVETYNQWTIVKDNNYLEFYADASNRLYGNKADDGLRVGSTYNATTNHQFIIYDGYLFNIQSTRYVGVNISNNEWYSYQTNTGNIKDQTLKFYKKTIVYTSYTNYSTSCMTGVCDITNANPIYITSAVGQKIKATDKLVLTTTDMAVGTEISLSAPNITFYKEGKEITKLTTTATSETFELEIAYKPIIANTTEQPTITLEILGYQFAFNNKITGRCLPEAFVIAAKWGNNWYALPANMSSETTAEGLLIEVDNPTTPAKAIAAPNTTKYSLKAVYKSNQSADRFAEFGNRLVFVEEVEEATPVANKTLYNGGGDAQNSSKTNIQVYAQYSGYYTTNPDRYEWIPTTTDLKDYTLTSAHVFTDEAARTISLDNHGVFGTLLQNKSYNGMVRLLPVESFYTPTELQVVEWKEDGVSIMYTGSGTKATTKVGNNDEGDVQLLSEKKIDHAVYTLSTSDLIAATNQVLTISIQDNDGNIIGTHKMTVPWILNSSKSSDEITSEVTQATDIVVLNGATLTAANTKHTYDDVVVYPGGKLVIGVDDKLGMYSLTLRLGSSWGAAEYEHKYPEFVLNTKTSQAYTNTSGKINLDYLTTKDQYYTFVAPFEVKTKDIKYPVDIYGSNVEAANRGSFEFQYYDGAARAAGEKGWKVVEEDPTDGATLTAHQGYTFYGMPKKVSVNGGTSTRQKFGIHRIPMTETAANVMSHENNEQTVAISAHPSEKNINSGWNLIGNPYMSTITGLDNQSIVTGTIVLVDNRWEWSDDDTYNQRFIVFPSNDGEWYYTSQAANAELPAFKNFFVQIANEEATTLAIPRNTAMAQLLAPAHRTAEEIEHDIEMAIVLEKDEANSDQLDFLINDTYGAGFDYNADFTKMMNATNFNLYGVHMDDNLSFVALDHYSARGSVAIGYQVPVAGEYTLRISDKPYVMLNKIEALYVTDHEMNPAVTTNLMEEDYVFHVGKAETNDTRFTISLTVETNTNGDDITTDMSEVDIHSKQPQKFFYDSKLYILRDGKIYSATGHEIQTINK